MRTITSRYCWCALTANGKLKQPNPFMYSFPRKKKSPVDLWLSVNLLRPFEFLEISKNSLERLKSARIDIFFKKRRLELR
jgi:hypothetical protein